MKTVRIKMLKTRDALQAGRTYNISEKAANHLIETGRAELEKPEDIKPVWPPETKPVEPIETKPIVPPENKVKKNSRRSSKIKES